ncbi:hypothetical protein JHN48_34590, partial [Streptomyces sp. MBT72]|uniref:hypothetical protein n=1 Tax=Streptomyces sp. MBT72 TaxID=1488402 RepID=UPI00191535B5
MNIPDDLDVPHGADEPRDPLQEAFGGIGEVSGQRAGEVQVVRQEFPHPNALLVGGGSPLQDAVVVAQDLG